jgi:hypothetical protein
MVFAERRRLRRVPHRAILPKQPIGLVLFDGPIVVHVRFPMNVHRPQMRQAPTTAKWRGLAPRLASNARLSTNPAAASPPGRPNAARRAGSGHAANPPGKPGQARCVVPLQAARRVGLAEAHQVVTEKLTCPGRADLRVYRDRREDLVRRW